MADAAIASVQSARLERAWLMLAVAAFALSALFAAGLVMARAPFLAFLGLGRGSFRAALVTHVNLSVLVWFFAFAVLQWLRAAPQRDESLRWLAFVLALLGTGTMVASTFAGGTPLLANYFPALDHPLFFAGTAWFVLGVLISVLAGIRRIWAGLRDSDPARLAACAAVLPFLAALASFAWASARPAVSAWDTAGYEARLWGAGHLAQFVYVLLMMAVWWELAAGGRSTAREARLARLAVWLTAVPGFAGLVLHAAYAGDAEALRHGFTVLMSGASWPGALLLLAVCARRLRQMDGFSRAAFIVSSALFVAGCVAGAFIRQDSPLIPAHYHFTIGAVTVAFMAWLYRHGEDWGLCPDLRRASHQLIVYGSGLGLLAAGLAGSSFAGAQRKVAHAEVLQSGSGYLAAMSAAAIGGLIALFGAAWFVANLVRSLRNETATQRRRDVRLRALAITCFVIIATGCTLAWWPQSDPLAAQKQQALEHARVKQMEEVRARFDQGVVMLHAKQYDHALTAFHRVLAITPDMPEAHVNMGFALIGLERYKEAGDFFEAATELRLDQVNAYYGLALSLEAMGNLPGAIGAMRSYIHLSKPDDPYRRKAESAVWEWEEQRTKVRAQHASAGAAAPAPAARTAARPSAGRPSGSN